MRCCCCKKKNVKNVKSKKEELLIIVGSHGALNYCTVPYYHVQLSMEIKEQIKIVAVDLIFICNNVNVYEKTVAACTASCCYCVFLLLHITRC
jgi:hypothetical protein